MFWWLRHVAYLFEDFIHWCTLCSSYCCLKAPTTGRGAQSNPKVTQKGPLVPRVRWCHQAETKGGVGQVVASEISVSFSFTTGANGGREKAKEDQYRSARGGRRQPPRNYLHMWEELVWPYGGKSWWITLRNSSVSHCIFEFKILFYFFTLWVATLLTIFKMLAFFFFL